jgi:hypothetical protein
MEEMPLNIKIENVRGKINSALSEAIMEYGLPAFLVSGILADIMLDIKRQEKIELTNSYNNISKLTGNEGKVNSD